MKGRIRKAVQAYLNTGANRMSWKHFFLGAVTTVAGPRVLKRVVHTAAKGVMLAKAEVGKVMVEVEKEAAAARSATPPPAHTGKA